jgi:tetratricopeptide (TPR) repeat protein
MNAKEIMQQGVEKVNNGDIEGGLKMVSEAISLDPLDPEKHHFKGLVNAHLKNLVEAIVDYKKAISLNSNVFQYHYNLGNVYMDCKQYPQAIECYTNSSRINPTDLEIIANRGMCYLKNSQLTEAKSDFEHVLKTDTFNRVAVHGMRTIDIMIKFQQRDNI